MDGADLNIHTESPGPALTYPLLEALRLFGTEKKVKHAVKAQTWRLCQSADGVVVQTLTLRVKEDESLQVTLDRLTENPAPNPAARFDGTCQETTAQDLTNQALGHHTWETEVPEGTMTAGLSQGSFPKESRPVEEEGDYIAEGAGLENEEVLALPLFEDLHHENHPLSGPQNQWRRLDLRTQNRHPGMTLHVTGAPRRQMGRNLLMEFLRVAERGPADPGLPDPQGRTSPLDFGG